MNKNYLLVLMVLVIALFSCQKEPVEVVNDEVVSTKSAQIVLDEITVENTVEEVNYESAFYSLAENSLWNLFQGGSKWGWKGSLRYKIGQCPDVTIDRGDDDGYPRTITLNYGDSTVLRNGKVMSGSVVIYISSPPNTDGYIKEVTYDNFSVDSISVAGNSTIAFAGDNVTESRHTLTSDLIVTMADGTVLKRQEEKVREWLSGLDTELDQTDDTIQVTGYVQVDVDTLSYRKEIVDPLIKSGECRHFIAGVVEFYENSTLFASIDYGDGTCDDSAWLTKDGETVEVELQWKEPKINNGNHFGQNKDNSQNSGDNGNHSEGNNGDNGNHGVGNNGGGNGNGN